MPESWENTLIDLTYALTNYGLRIPLSIYAIRSWDMEDATTLRLLVEGLRDTRVTVESPNLKYYDYLKIAILADLVERSAVTIAVLLGCKDRRYKRIPTKEHIILPRPTKWRVPEIVFIE